MKFSASKFGVIQPATFLISLKNELLCRHVPENSNCVTEHLFEKTFQWLHLRYVTNSF